MKDIARKDNKAESASRLSRVLEQRVPIGDIEMNYKVYGEGPPLLLLHGFFANSGVMWDPFIPELAKHYALVLPDLRGHGHSTNPSGQFSHSQVALDIFGLLDQLGIEKVRGIGYSLGGMALLNMAVSQPSKIESMIVINATHRRTQEAVAKKRDMKAKGVDREFIRKLQAWHENAEQVNELVRIFQQETREGDNEFTSEQLSMIEARTLIVHGDRDTFFPVYVPLEMYQSIPESYLWIVPNGDHLLFFDNLSGAKPGPEARQFIKVAIDFLGCKWQS